jgi:hypothetical protein
VRLVSSLKRALLPIGSAPRTVKSGAFRGLKMEMNLQNATQFWAGLYERETYPWLNRFGVDCGSGMDVGAAQGEFSLYLLTKTRAARIFAFDPDEEYRAVFTRNLGLNGLEGDARLIRITKFAGSGEGGSVRLDSFGTELPSPVFLRIDVDGLELEVLAGMVELLEAKRVRLLLETHSANLEGACARFLQERGCGTRVVENAWWRAMIKDQRPIGHNRWLVASNDPDSPV